MASTEVTRLELDLDVFAGPFDLLLSLILREELDLLEVELADVVLAYLDHLDARDELDLESATEFLVLIAALLELKSRLMLPGEEIEELDELAPAEAAEELLERMLAYARFRGAGGFLARAARGRAGRPLPLGAAAAGAPPRPRRAGPAGLRPGRARRGARRAAAHAAADGPAPHRDAARVAAGAARRAARGCCARGAFSFDEAVRGADRMTVAVTLYALLELYKRGEAAWEQEESFGPVTVRAGAPEADPGGRVIERELEALLFLAPDPVAGRRAGRRAARRRGRGRGRAARARARARRPRDRAARARRRLDARVAPRRRGGRRGGCSPARARPGSRPAQAETLSIVAYLQPVSRPEVARIRGVASESAAAALVERGLIEEAGRSQFGAVLYRTTPLFLELFGLRSVDELPDPAEWDPSPEEQAALRDRLLRAGEARGGGPAAG